MVRARVKPSWRCGVRGRPISIALFGRNASKTSGSRPVKTTRKVLFLLVGGADLSSPRPTLSLTKQALRELRKAEVQLPRTPLLETVWKRRGGCDGGLRSALWRTSDIPRICPTTNGVASARIFPSPPGEDAPGCTACGPSSMPSSTCSRAVVRGGCWRRSSRPGRPSRTGLEPGASTAPGSD